MTIYRDRNGVEMVVCDGCGIDGDGRKPDLATLTKVDLGAEMRAAGFPAGTDLNVKDWCPDCNANAKKARVN